MGGLGAGAGQAWPGECGVAEIRGDRLPPAGCVLNVAPATGAINSAECNPYRSGSFCAHRTPAGPALRWGFVLSARLYPWQYAQLTIMVDGRAAPEPKRTALRQGPGPGTDQDCSDISQTLPELSTRFGADGWELVALQQHREGGMGTSYWDAVCSVATYTSKRLVPSLG
jgi:hypothetical protein